MKSLSNQQRLHQVNTAQLYENYRAAQTLAKKLPRYPSVPAVRMGRLAVSDSFKGKGLGAALLADALRRAATAEIAAYALVVDAKDESAAGFYAHHGFVVLPEQPLFLFLHLATVKSLLD